MASSFAEVVCIGVAKTGKAAEEEDVADGLNGGFERLECRIASDFYF